MSTPPFVTTPEDVHPVLIATSGGPLAALQSGRSTASRGTAVLVPGYTGSKEDFISIIGPLTQAGFTVLALDQRGQCDSPGAAPEDAADAYTLGRLGQDVLEAVDAVSPDEPVHLLGHSFGGLVAREAALKDPSRIRTLTLLCSGPAAIRGASAEGATLLAGAASLLPLPDIWAQMKRMEAEAGRPEHLDPEVREFLHRRFLANDPAMLVGMAGEITTAPDRVAELKATGLPIRVVCGAGDDAWPVEVQKDMAERLDAPFHVIEGAAHSPAVETPDEVVEYLTELWTS